MGSSRVDEIERARNAVIDWEITADDRRRDLERAQELFAEAVRERDQAASWLAVLIVDRPADDGPADV